MRRRLEDPFGECSQAHLTARVMVLGGDFLVDSTDEGLLKLTCDAFGDLPRHRLSHRPPRFNVRLVLSDHRSTWPRGTEPPRPVLSAGGGLLCATVDAGNFVVVDPMTSRALICVSRSMLRHAYHARYELIELALITLASRAQSLVPLHAACVGASGSGVLMMGASGAGKSTLCLHALAAGMELSSEDSSFVALEGLRITGVPNYLHLRRPSLAFLAPGTLREQVQASPMIRRRSGELKFELDLRRIGHKIAAEPPRLVATVILSRRRAGRQRPLRRLTPTDFLARLRSEQPYGVRRTNWRDFERRVVTVPSYELRRTEHPDTAVALLRDLLNP